MGDVGRESRGAVIMAECQLVIHDILCEQFVDTAVTGRDEYPVIACHDDVGDTATAEALFAVGFSQMFLESDLREVVSTDIRHEQSAHRSYEQLVGRCDEKSTNTDVQRCFPPR